MIGRECKPRTVPQSQHFLLRERLRNAHRRLNEPSVLTIAPAEANINPAPVRPPPDRKRDLPRPSPRVQTPKRLPPPPTPTESLKMSDRRTRVAKQYIDSPNVRQAFAQQH